MLTKTKLIGVGTVLHLPIGAKDDMKASVADTMMNVVNDTANDIVEMIDVGDNVEIIV